MAARKRFEDQQPSLFGPAPAPPPVSVPEPMAPAPAPTPPMFIPMVAPALARAVAQLPPQLPRRPPAEPDGIAVVRDINGWFYVTRVRDNGGSAIGVYYTREEFEALVAAAIEAMR